MEKTKRPSPNANTWRKAIGSSIIIITTFGCFWLHGILEKPDFQAFFSFAAASGRAASGPHNLRNYYKHKDLTLLKGIFSIGVHLQRLCEQLWSPDQIFADGMDTSPSKNAV